MQQLFLASASPRRKELLEKAGFSFVIHPSNISEFPQEKLNVDEQILDIAKRKARAALASLKTKTQQAFWVLAADTEVILNNRLTGKPADAQDAKRMLRELSNKTHEVKTGLVLLSYPSLRELSHIETSTVSFWDLSDDQIESYVKTGIPMDKAGAYGIQDEGRNFVREIKGLVDNVVGLPIDIVERLFEDMERLEMSALSQLQKEIVEHCHRLGRNPDEVRVVAVSKLQPIEKIEALFSEGQRTFGENYVQEALAKGIDYSKVFGVDQAQEIKWHFIGHLQRKKINSILDRFDLIHSIDSLALAEALSARVRERQGFQKILLEVNVSQEESKNGFSPQELKKHWSFLRELPGLRILGLMTMPPSAENPEDVRIYFRTLRLLKDELNALAGEQILTELSMGTSQDYLVAIEEGATYIRIGLRLFGERLIK